MRSHAASREWWELRLRVKSSSYVRKATGEKIGGPIFDELLASGNQCGFPTLTVKSELLASNTSAFLVEGSTIMRTFAVETQAS